APCRRRKFDPLMRDVGEQKQQDAGRETHERGPPSDREPFEDPQRSQTDVDWHQPCDETEKPGVEHIGQRATRFAACITLLWIMIGWWVRTARNALASRDRSRRRYGLILMTFVGQAVSQAMQSMQSDSR